MKRAVIRFSIAAKPIRHSYRCRLPAKVSQRIPTAQALREATRNRGLALSAAVIGERVRASSRDPKEVREALANLKNLVVAARSDSFAEELYEARLAFGEIEIHFTEPAVGRSYLEALQKEASSQGDQLIARKAAAIWGESRNQAALQPKR